MSKNIIIILAVVSVTLNPLASPHVLFGSQRYLGQEEVCLTFLETGKKVCDRFLEYWKLNGGLSRFGYPISETMDEISALDIKTYPVQYFERAVFEYHPDNQAPYDVLLSQLGLFQYKNKYPGGAFNQEPDTTGEFFRETNHWIGGKFWEYWRANGGLLQYGYPISDEFIELNEQDRNPYRVQYFERAIFELHPYHLPPYDVLLSHLGRSRWAAISGKVSPTLEGQFKPDPKSKFTYLVVLVEQADTSNDIKDWNEKGQYVYNKLKEVADRTQPPVAALLDKLKARGNVESYKRYIISNALSARGDLASARAIATLPALARVMEFPRVQFESGP